MHPPYTKHDLLTAAEAMLPFLNGVNIDRLQRFGLNRHNRRAMGLKARRGTLTASDLPPWLIANTLNAGAAA